MTFNYTRDYFTWLYDMVCEGRYSTKVSYKKLLGYLYNKNFRYTIRLDANRAEDGRDLRHRFAQEYSLVTSRIDEIERELTGPCSVLEMLVALSLRCEETIMDDPHKGDRTKQWFWHMIVNLGLGSMHDDLYDEELVENAIEKFLNRDYDPDGRGGLVTIRNCDYDLRVVEIWTQLMWYLDTLM